MRAWPGAERAAACANRADQLLEARAAAVRRHERLSEECAAGGEPVERAGQRCAPGELWMLSSSSCCSCAPPGCFWAACPPPARSGAAAVTWHLLLQASTAAPEAEPESPLAWLTATISQWLALIRGLTLASLSAASGAVAGAGLALLLFLLFTFSLSPPRDTFARPLALDFSASDLVGQARFLPEAQLGDGLLPTAPQRDARWGGLLGGVGGAQALGAGLCCQEDCLECMDVQMGANTSSHDLPRAVCHRSA